MDRGKLTVVSASSSVSTIAGVAFAHVAWLLRIALSGQEGQRWLPSGLP